ncbi:MAG TPA: hypothetical protein VEZ24_14930 [Microvirga sp.]|nr:hypothetical protein [Microvirga sp.]
MPLSIQAGLCARRAARRHTRIHPHRREPAQRRRCGSRCSGGGVSVQPAGGPLQSRRKAQGRGSKAYIFGIWGGIALVSGLVAMIDACAFAEASSGVIAAVTAIAAGAILAMLIDAAGCFLKPTLRAVSKQGTGCDVTRRKFLE